MDMPMNAIAAGLAGGRIPAELSYLNLRRRGTTGDRQTLRRLWDDIFGRRIRFVVMARSHLPNRGVRKLDANFEYENIFDLWWGQVALDETHQAANGEGSLDQYWRRRLSFKREGGSRWTLGDRIERFARDPKILRPKV